jgi:hypothetical protein
MFLSDLNVDMLKECANGLEEKNIIDIGSGWGSTVWKELLAGCKTTAYDISYQLKQTNKNFDKYVSQRVPKEIFNENLIKITGDILNIREEHPEILGSFDLVNSQNLIHFFGPSNCLKFANIVYDLLKPGGKAFISAESYQQYKNDDTTCLEVYNYNKQSGSKFPGQIYYESFFNNPAKCFRNNSGELFVIDPYYEDTTAFTKIGVDNKFDLETLEYVFKNAGFEVQESFYLAFTGKEGITLRKNDNHPFDKFAGIIVTKSLETSGEITEYTEHEL